MTLKKINSLVKDYIDETEPSENDFKFIESIIDIVLSTPIKVRRQTYKEYYPIESSINDVSKFYGTLDLKYIERFRNLIKSGDMRFFNVSKKGRNNYIASSTMTDDGKSDIFLPFNNTIEDSFTMNHEVLHDTNVSLKLTETRFLFTEAISILGELLQEDFYRRSLLPPKEFEKNSIDMAYAICVKSIYLHIQIGLIKLMQKYGEITSKNLSELEMLKCYRKDLKKYLKYLNLFDELPFDNDQRHVMGFVFASQMHQDGFGKEHLLELNPILNEVEFDDVLDSIGVSTTSIDGYDITSDSKKVLLKSYREEVSRFR